jgi:hypothetical protein
MPGVAQMPGAAQMPFHPWQPMLNGVFQQAQPFASNPQAFFPTHPIVPPGYHFGLVPNFVFPQSLNTGTTQVGSNIQAQLHGNDDLRNPTQPKESNRGDQVDKPDADPK